MEHFVSTLSRERSEALAGEFEEAFDMYGFGFWAVDAPGVGAFAGFIGFSVPRFQARFAPCVEIGGRLSAYYWGSGLCHRRRQSGATIWTPHLATGRNRGDHGATQCSLATRDGEDRDVHNPAEDFDHPLVPDGHLLRRHVFVPAQQSRAAIKRNGCCGGTRHARVPCRCSTCESERPTTSAKFRARRIRSRDSRS